MYWLIGFLFITCVILAVRLIRVELELDARDLEDEEERKRLAAKTIPFPKEPFVPTLVRDE
jgi:hypothetical protein